MKILLSFICLLTIHCLLFTNPVRAADQFQVDYDIHYIFNATGASQVTNTIYLTNTAPGIYPSSYDLILTGDPPKHITGSDQKGPLTITVSRDFPYQTRLHLVFNHISAGLGQKQKFTLVYDGQPAIFSSHTWKINLPQTVNPSPSDTTAIALEIPAEFGQSLYLQPAPASQSGKTYYFSGPSVARGVTAVFGDFSIQSFSAVFPPAREITVPADSAAQKVFITKISPPPSNLESGKSNNWFAVYHELPSSDITVTGYAFLYESPPHPVSPPAYTWIPGVYSESDQLPPELSWKFSRQFLPLQQNVADLTITNPNSFALPDFPLTIENYSGYSKNLHLLPLSHVTIPIIFPRRFLPPLSSEPLLLKLGAHDFRYNVPGSTYSLWYVLLVFITSGFLLTLAAFTAKSWHLHLQKHHRPHSLRR